MRTVVLTNGCFDILHVGHVIYLQQARELGDWLIVGLNSDASVRALKGPARPINPQDDRATVLSALSCVDEVVIFDELTPERLIRDIRPDIYVKGGDYTEANLPERDLVTTLGGVVRCLEHVPGRSTSALVAQMSNSGRTWQETRRISE
ncbi:D-glycero-beta-D-manno-heptose 1-phosphate adenylyltransferase [Luedemannella helvata]|uniref:D-glycero-beta-D-manno-heptose 1-phosphate adenylyltransferase n=1 Tax=Luedemannella helvata TaxID=349315 RepID=A0ABP4W9Y9_9ACTN